MSISIGLEWIGLGCVELGWIGLSGVHWAGLDWTGSEFRYGLARVERQNTLHQRLILGTQTDKIRLNRDHEYPAITNVNRT